MSSENLKFEVQAVSGKARRGQLHTAHGIINTPAFMPVGTAGTVKAMKPEDVAATGAEIILGNTYHLMLRPGAERINRLGGLHRFMNWPGPILTDSGGYQVFSLSQRRTIGEDGVVFQSHIDGARVDLTPERAVEIQHLLGSDITMVLDECTGWPVTEAEARASMELSMRWAARCKAAFRARTGYGLFGIVQGSVFPHLRRDSAAALIDIGFDGYAVGGLAIGEGQETTFSVLDATVPSLPTDHPRYLMGVGKPADILGAVRRGIDMFDCVLPTRSGRNGQVFVRGGTLNLRNARHTDDPGPLDAACTCPPCRHYSRAYLHHLIKAGEMLAGMLLTAHNLHYYQTMMSTIRQAIEENALDAFADTFEAEQAVGPDVSETPPKT
ncbi:MAG: tRNA guanosine(34) transglycosylase Tgt [Proteobacteria bacterium]|nr:tRNA guanosine(34) transglycosylase Tgt [Pseudomonadota bacterium]